MDTDNGPFLESAGSIYRLNIVKITWNRFFDYLLSELRNNLRITAR